VDVVSGPVHLDPLAVGCGITAGVGLWLVATAGSGLIAAARRLVARRLAGLTPRARAVRIGGAVTAGLVVGVGTGWPAAGLLALAAALTLPDVLVVGRQVSEQTARIEAVAAWAEQLRDSLAGASGLLQAIAATGPRAPLAIRAEVAVLAAALQRPDIPPSRALEAFADTLADPTADLVVAALDLALTRQAGQLGALLGELATTARDDAALRLRTVAGRARIRSSARIIIATTVLLAAGLIMFSPAFADPYASPGGQLMLLVIGGVFALGTGWLARMSRLPVPARTLAQEPTTGPAGPGVGAGRGR
jgi:Flp pilus assembly protein TadB